MRAITSHLKWLPVPFFCCIIHCQKLQKFLRPISNLYLLLGLPEGRIIIEDISKFFINLVSGIYSFIFLIQWIFIVICYLETCYIIVHMIWMINSRGQIWEWWMLMNFKYHCGSNKIFQLKIIHTKREIQRSKERHYEGPNLSW